MEQNFPELILWLTVTGDVETWELLEVVILKEVVVSEHGTHYPWPGSPEYLLRKQKQPTEGDVTDMSVGILIIIRLRLLINDTYRTSFWINLYCASGMKISLKTSHKKVNGYVGKKWEKNAIWMKIITKWMSQIESNLTKYPSASPCSSSPCSFRIVGSTPKKGNVWNVRQMSKWINKKTDWLCEMATVWLQTSHSHQHLCTIFTLSHHFILRISVKERLLLTADPGFSGVAAGRGVRTWPPCRVTNHLTSLTPEIAAL